MPSSLAVLPKGAMPFVFSESRDISRVGGYGTINSGLRSDSSVAGSMGRRQMARFRNDQESISLHTLPIFSHRRLAGLSAVGR